MKRRSSRFDGFGFSSVSAEKKVRLMLRSALARAYSALTMWLALPSPSGSPTTRLVPTSRMISSAIASGSENSFGIKGWLGNNWESQRPESDAGRRQL